MFFKGKTKTKQQIKILQGSGPGRHYGVGSKRDRKIEGEVELRFAAF
jgi:hypothetical protein